ncbi:MAG: AmmeMemoRadiSam system radical SAM enzyme [Lentisphaerae bacterium GWF2_38_69]|nr:MAG: AmmeMemoRadiSam system radical SAM enzyme [Lentisphaerae bacterium GWF2_38_69]
MRSASYWHRVDLGVQCDLCPRNCFLTEGTRGQCKVRINKNNILYTMVYNQPAAINIDPIEKKPVFHMLPGTSIFSLSTAGCPLKCTFCQNWTLSQTYPEEIKNVEIITPEQIVYAALSRHIPSIAYTYGEPVAYYEYMRDIARIAHAKGLRNVMVTSGYINEKPLLELLPYFDVIKVDLKGMSKEFYREEVDGYLDSVLNTLKILRRENKLVEVVNLVVPNRNDSDEDFDKLTKWVHDNLGADTPVFFSKFHPDYKLANLPATPVKTLQRAVEIAKKNGLNFVYLGNVPSVDGENTYCPDDNTLLIERRGFMVNRINLKDGKCPTCGRELPGIWE